MNANALQDALSQCSASPETLSTTTRLFLQDLKFTADINTENRQLDVLLRVLTAESSFSKTSSMSACDISAEAKGLGRLTERVPNVRPNVVR